MPKIDLLNCPFCCGKADTFPLDKCDSYGNHERLWYSECGECFARSGYYNTEGEAAIAWNTRASGWIPCSERIPEKSMSVLISAKGHRVTAFYDSVKGVFMLTETEGLFYSMSAVTHWMPLPEPPKTQQKEFNGNA